MTMCNVFVVQTQIHLDDEPGLLDKCDKGVSHTTRD